VFEAPRRDTTGFDIRVHIGLLHPDHPTEPIGGQETFIDEPIEAA
jgi:hypothetical protein